MHKASYYFSVLVFSFCLRQAAAQEPYQQTHTKQKVQQLIEKKAEYHRLTNGVRDGYRIKIYFGVDREAAKEIRVNFNKMFPEVATYEEYQQPNWVVLVGDYLTKLEAFEWLKKVQTDFPNAFIVKSKIQP